MNHMEFALLETESLRPSKCEKWLDVLKNAVGHSLDGDQDADGYSLDFCVDLFLLGNTPGQALDILTGGTP